MSAFKNNDTLWVSVLCSAVIAGLSGCAIALDDPRDSELGSRELGQGICVHPATGEIEPCLPTAQLAAAVVWSPWLNRDLPGGSGDWETLADFGGLAGCALPSYIEATTTSGVSWQATGERLTVSPDVGLICQSAQQPDGACLDYQVRFGCTTRDYAFLTQSWHWDFTLGLGNIQHYVPLATPVPASRGPGIMTFRSDGSFETLRLSPDDAHYFVQGIWSRSGDLIVMALADPRQGNFVQRLQVAELSATTFRFRWQ